MDRSLLQSRAQGDTQLANLSGIVKQLKKERDRVERQLSGSASYRAAELQCLARAS